MTFASIPSPSVSVWHFGFPVRAYALCIIAGIIMACVITDRRMRARGATPMAILDIAIWAVPFGIGGARVYNVITTPQPYFGRGGSPISALYIWQGGLGIWGAVAGGALGAWFACRRLGISLTFVADCLAVGLPVAQAIGRLGNWFNNELYGRATTLPWGLRVHEMDPNNQGHALLGPDGKPVLLPGAFQPTFLYEGIWDLGTALLVYLADRKYKFGKGRAFALYVMTYTVGRAWIEYLRIDTANHFLGLRINDWVALVVFIGAVIYFLRVKGPREYVIATGTPDIHMGTEADYLAYLASDGAGTPAAGAEAASADKTAADPDADDPPGKPSEPGEPDEPGAVAEADPEADSETSGTSVPDDIAAKE